MVTIFNQGQAFVCYLKFLIQLIKLSWETNLVLWTTRIRFLFVHGDFMFMEDKHALGLTLHHVLGESVLPGYVVHHVDKLSCVVHRHLERFPLLPVEALVRVLNFG